LMRSPWNLLDPGGVSTGAGVMRSRRGRGGINYLEFDDVAAATHVDSSRETGGVTDVGCGPYGEQVWMFPVVGDDRRWSGTPPQRFAPAIEAMLPEGHRAVLDAALVWMYVPLPAGTHGVATAIQSVTPHAVTASNLEVAEERVNFALSGTTVALRPEGSGDRYLMRLLSVIGESGTRYVPESDLESISDTGRVRLRGDEIDLRPARRSGSRYDGWAKVRMLLCDGPRANGVEPGEVRTIADRMGNVTVQVRNVAPSRGGAAPPSAPAARLRFAELLRSRERVVTAADFDVASRAYDSRIESVVVRAVAETAGRALQPVDLVHVVVPRRGFADPEADRLRLQHGLEAHLTARGVLGRRVRVVVEVVER